MRRVIFCGLSIFFVLSSSLQPLFNSLRAQNKTALASSQTTPASPQATPADSTQPIEIPSDKAFELRTLYQTLVEAEHARDLARAIAEAKEQAWRAEYNAYVGTQYKLARELSVPQGWVLNVEKMRFQPVENTPQIPLKSP